MFLLVLISFLFVYSNADDFPIELPNMREPGDDDYGIVGGQETTIEKHPYQVSFIAKKFNLAYFCGGFIVSENYILTAAHCAKNVDPTTVVLRAGSTWRRNGTIIPIAEVIAHPEYNNPRFNKDVGVMRTVDPIKFTNTIQPIPLTWRGRPMKGDTQTVVSGWGRTQNDNITLPERLMDVQIPVVDYSKCKEAYSKVLTGNMWCGGNFDLGGQGACPGDSGGAAIQDGMAVGIVSFGGTCGLPRSPTVFADIAAPPIRDFIKKHTNL